MKEAFGVVERGRETNDDGTIGHAQIMSVENIIKVNKFLSSRAYATRNTEVREEFLGSREPALILIIAGIFGERWLLEVDVAV